MKKHLVALTCLVLSSACITRSEMTRTGGDEPSQSSAKMDRNERSLLPAEKWINALRISKVEVSPAAQINIEIENSSKEPIRIWKDSNSWGAMCWRVLLIRNGRLETFFQNPDQDFSRNAPTFDEISVGGHLYKKLDLNAGNWCGFGRCSIHSERGFAGTQLSFESNDLVVMIYDVTATPEAGDKRVWYGVLATSATVR